MKDDSLSDTDYCPKCDCYHSYKIDCSVGKQAVIAQDKIGRNVYYKETWNEAIEAAAKLIEYPTEEGSLYAATIRKLRK